MRPALLAPAVGLVILAASIAGFLGYQHWRASPSHGAGVAQSRLVPSTVAAVPDSASAAAPEVAANQPVPESVPELTLPDRNGQMKSLRDYLGTPLIINFWATWCAPCRREIPLLQQLRQTYKSQRLEVVGIAVDFRSAVDDYLTHTAVSYPLLIGEDQGLAAAQKFGMEPVLPFSVFADAGGRIIAVKVGELHRDEADYILAAMHSIAAGKMSIAAAREGISQKLRALAIERAKAASNNS